MYRPAKYAPLLMDSSDYTPKKAWQTIVPKIYAVSNAH